MMGLLSQTWSSPDRVSTLNSPHQNDSHPDTCDCSTQHKVLVTFWEPIIAYLSHDPPASWPSPCNSLCSCCCVLDFDVRLKLKTNKVKVEYSITELRPVFGSQTTGDVSHKPSGRLPLLSARSAVTLTTPKRAATNFAAWWTEAQWV